MEQPTTRLTPKQTASNYDLIADHFQVDRSRTTGLAYIDRFCGLLPSSPVILDIGCGTGVPITKRLVERRFTVHALDLSDKLISLAKRNIEGATFFKGDITTWVPP